MNTSKLLRISIAVLFVLGVVMIASPVAAEKFKWHGTSFVTETQTMDVGDDEGHMLMLFKQQQLYVNENTGVKEVSQSVNMMDINPKAKSATVKGYNVISDKDGDQRMTSHVGKMVGKNQWAGTFIYTKGTGKFEGIKGNGTWNSYSMGQGQPSYMELEAEFEVPAK
jgi:hypothetical protein